MLIDTNTGALLRNLLDAYAVHGGDAAGSVDLAVKLRTAEIIALSVTFLRNSKHAAYRVATLSDGSQYLAVRYRGRQSWLPVFAVARLDRLVATGWTLRSELAS